MKGICFMFVESFKNCGNLYLRLVSSVHTLTKEGKHSSTKKVIYNIGPLSKFDDGKPDYVKRLKESFKNGNPIISELLPYCEKRPLEEYRFKLVENDPNCIGNPKLFSNILIERILEKLDLISFLTKMKARTDISFDLVGFFRLLVYGRILNPASKFASANQNQDYYHPIIKNPYLFNVYDTLDFIYTYRQNIIRKLNSSLTDKFNRTTNIVYYDVTNFFFEIEKADSNVENDDKIVYGDRQFGVSKEERKLPIIQMGLFMDEQGVPISIETFPGNTLDHLTMIQACKNTINTLGLKRFIFVGDRGMCSYKNICHLIDHNNGYVISKSIEKSNQEEKNWIMNPEKYVIVSDDFKYKSRIVKRTVIDENNQKRDIVEKVVVYWSKDFAEREKAMQKSFIEFLNKVIKEPQNFRITNLQYKSLRPFFKKDVKIEKTGEVINSNDIKLFIDTDKVNDFVSHMGYYQIVTSETNMADREIIEIYHGLSKIENQFRIMKSTLETRPIYVRTHEHIYSHLLICMISLIVMRIIQNKIVDYQEKKHLVKAKHYWSMGLTSERIQKALNKWTVEELTDGYYRFNNINDDDLKLILQAFNITIPTKLFKILELKQIKQTIDLSI